MWNDLNAGKKTIAEVADFAGVSARAVSKQRKKKFPSSTMAVPTIKSPPAASPYGDPIPTNPSDPSPNAETLAICFATLALIRAYNELTCPSNGASQIKNATSAGVAAIAELRLLGEIKESSGEFLGELRVSVMSDEEFKEMKAKVREASKEKSADIEESKPPEETEMKKPFSGFSLNALLPEKQNFRGWLEELGQSRGNRHLRDLCRKLGQEVGPGADRDHVIDLILFATDGDPQRLSTFNNRT